MRSQEWNLKILINLKLLSACKYCMIRSPLLVLFLIFFMDFAAASDMPRFQQMEINSASKEVILDYQINYGNHQAPMLRDRRFSGEGHENILRRISETMTVPIPESADVMWRTGNGNVHYARIPVRSRISDMENFYGVKFLFVDDHVDLYFIYKIKNSTMYLNLQYTKVYSSTPER